MAQGKGTIGALIRDDEAVRTFVARWLSGGSGSRSGLH